MRSPRRKDFGVYDFNEEDEAVEKSQLARFGKRSANPRDDDSPVDKIKFLQVFAPGMNCSEKGRMDVMCVDAGKMNGEHEANFHGSCTLSPAEVNVVDASHATSEEESPKSARSKHGDSSHDEYGGNMSPECSKEELLDERVPRTITLSASRNESDCDFLERSSNLKEQDLNSDDDDNWTVSSSCHSPDHSGNEGSKDQLDTIDSCNIFKGVDNTDVAVIVSPDYVVYGPKFYADSRLIFSRDCVRIECFDAYGSDESFNFEWAIEDLIHIDCLWSRSVQTVWVEVQSALTDEIGSNGMHGVPGTVSLIFTVSGQQWFCDEQKIMSLAPRYKDVLKVKSITRKAVFPDNFVGTNPFFTSCYLTDFEGTFEDVVFPEGDPDAVSVSRRDIELLQPETFINDTIIDFYIKYLKRNMKPEENNRFHFFNSFFFRKLADMDKDPQSRLEGRAAFLRVRKWTRKVNIFEKDYLFIPVNFNLHWSLLIVCHPGEIANFEEKNKADSLKVPCLLHLDSLRGSHSGLKNLMQSYLWEEWKERHPESPMGTSYKFLNLRFISLELPQQENMFDCGLFLLHYVELFLKQAPVNFSPFSITNLSSFLNSEWFLPAEASFKRFLIRNLLYDLLRRTSQNGPFSCRNEDHWSEFPNNNLVKEQSAELFSNNCHTVSPGLGVSDRSVVDRGVELELWARSSPNGAQCAKDDGLVARQIFVPETTAGSCVDRRKFSLLGITSLRKQRCALSPIEEGAEQIVYPDTGKDILQPLNGIITTEICSTSYSCLDFGALDTSHTLKNPLQVEKHEDDDSLFETLKTGSQNLIKQSLSETDANDCNSLPDSSGLISIKNGEVDGLKSLSSGNCGYSHENTTDSSSGEMLNTRTVGDSQEINAGLADLSNKGINLTLVLQEKHEDVQVNLGVSISQGMLETCIVEDSQGVDADEGMEKTQSVSPEKHVPGSHGASHSGSMLETCVVEDSQGVYANKEMLKLESDPLDKYEDVPESPRSSTSQEMETGIINNSQELVTRSENDDNDGSFHSCKEHQLDLPCQEVDPSPICNVVSLDDGDVQTNSDNMVVIPERQSYKRRKLQHTGNGRIQTRSLSRNSSF